jgi:hypothetical protein
MLLRRRLYTFLGESVKTKNVTDFHYFTYFNDYFKNTGKMSWRLRRNLGGAIFSLPFSAMAEYRLYESQIQRLLPCRFQFIHIRRE